MAKLVEDQMERNKTTGKPIEHNRVQYLMPTLKGVPSPIPITQDDEDDEEQDEILWPRRSVRVHSQ